MEILFIKYSKTHSMNEEIEYLLFTCFYLLITGTFVDCYFMDNILLFIGLLSIFSVLSARIGVFYNYSFYEKCFNEDVYKNRIILLVFESLPVYFTAFIISYLEGDISADISNETEKKLNLDDKNENLGNKTENLGNKTENLNNKSDIVGNNNQFNNYNLKGLDPNTSGLLDHSDTLTNSSNLVQNQSDSFKQKSVFEPYFNICTVLYLIMGIVQLINIRRKNKFKIIEQNTECCRVKIDKISGISVFCRINEIFLYLVLTAKTENMSFVVFYFSFDFLFRLFPFKIPKNNIFKLIKIFITISTFYFIINQNYLNIILTGCIFTMNGFTNQMVYNSIQYTLMEKTIENFIVFGLFSLLLPFFAKRSCLKDFIFFNDVKL